MKFILLLLLPSVLFSQGTSVIFKNVNIINVEKGKIIPNQNILIEGNLIKKISSKPLFSHKATIVDATGKYLIPGLCDFNAKVLDYENSGIAAFKLMLANGVTSVRDHSAPLSPRDAYKIKSEIEKRKIIGPRLYLSGSRFVDRLPSRQDILKVSAFIKTVAEAVNVVDSMVYWGCDIIELRKIVDESILKAIINEAHKKNKKVLSSYSGDWIFVSNLKIDALTHSLELPRVTAKKRQIYFDFTAKDSMRMRAVSDSEFFNQVIPSLGPVDTAYFYSLIDAFKKNKTWICTNSTGFVFSKMKFEYADSLRNQFRTSKLNNQKLADEQRSKKISISELNEEKITNSLIIMANKAGVPLLAGTELQGFLTPGMSLHDMLYWLVDGGLSPAEALRTATINPSIFLNKSKSIGTIEEGKLADLVLLNANPLTNISNTRNINAVMANGRLFQRSDLDKFLESAKISKD
jgi:hypothetical protein